MCYLGVIKIREIVAFGRKGYLPNDGIFNENQLLKLSNLYNPKNIN
jgi:hypothetical protein